MLALSTNVSIIVFVAKRGGGDFGLFMAREVCGGRVPLGIQLFTLNLLLLQFVLSRQVPLE